jgi:TonB family protein
VTVEQQKSTCTETKALAPLEISVWEPPRPLPLPPVDPRERVRIQRVITALVIALHVAAIYGVCRQSASGKEAPIQEYTVIIATLISETRPGDTSPLYEEPKLTPPVISLPDRLLLRIEDPDSSASRPIRASTGFRPPHLDPSFAISEMSVLRRSGVHLERSMTVVLALDIAANGTVQAIAVEQTSGDPAVDEAAINYARACRWIPGLENGQQAAMRIRFPVTLHASGSGERPS